MKASADSALDATPIEVFTKNGGSGRLKLRKGVIVALTLEGLYYAGRAVVERVVNRDLYLVCVQILDVPDNLDMQIPFPEGDLVFLRQCPIRSIVWKANNVYPYAESEESTCAGVGRQPIQVNMDEKPIQQFLSFNVNMEVALLHSVCKDLLYVGHGVIEECSLKGFWNGFRLPHSFFLVVKLLHVVDDFKDYNAYCEIPEFMTLKLCVGYRVLWSGYKVRLVKNSHVVGSSVGCQPTCSFQSYLKMKNVDVNCESRGSSTNVREEFLGMAEGRIPVVASDEDDRDDRLYSSDDDSRGSVDDHLNIHGHSTSGNGGSETNTLHSFVQVDVFIGSSGSEDVNCSSKGMQSDLLFPDRPLWRNQYCEVLNDDFSFFERTMIQVCLSNKACDDGVLEDSDVGVMFVSDHEALQMTTMRWRLSHARLEGGRLLSEIVMLCSQIAEQIRLDEVGLQRVPKNRYRLVKRRVISKNRTSVSKLQTKTSELDI